MIEDSGTYFLYRHLRLDNNIPFYIGIGKKPKEYRRAFEAKSKRSDFWHRIVNKYGYIVEILLESNNQEFIKEKEKEFIKLYGRIDTDKGILCNLTDGGDGCKNFIPLPEHLYKMREYQKQHKRKILLLAENGEVYKEFNSVTECSTFLNTSRGNIKLVCKQLHSSLDGRISRSVRGYLACYYDDYKSNFFRLDKTDSKNKVINNLKRITQNNIKPVYQYDLSGKFLKLFKSGVEADAELNLKLGTCSNMASRNHRHEFIGSIKGYYFFQKEMNFNQVIRIKRKNGLTSLKFDK